MSEPILVTGGTGALGRVVVARLAEHGRLARVMSRRPEPADLYGHEWATADLDTGAGLDEALTGLDVVIHCATGMNGKKEAAQATTLADAARRAGCRHLVYVSIVGVDRVPLGYYRGKLAAEEIFARSGVPYTILRATQFHDLVRLMFAGAAKLPVMPVPGCSFQPVDVRDVAGRLVALATGDPVGRVLEMGGPQARPARELARAYLRATGRRRPVAAVRVPGRLGRALRQGGNLAPEHADGVITFEDYLAAHPEPAGMSYRGSRR
ncbi:NAD(P)H-binding protein [Amycolatopsis cynarae]|uniref:NAD(P)H-binding protein n=1 Tax=Amycolatopsis cynarae TaxID=2995223 RepID=A0ABY7B1N3_9PSEU|nr:NAD(P)H-binding protein [Amycolatopsis sp. HUAS 11-8]WAL66096.1 NAD(P)H-binding protein [Amycolatopsis sp. HUAS 11-8]